MSGYHFDKQNPRTLKEAKENQTYLISGGPARYKSQDKWDAKDHVCLHTNRVVQTLARMKWDELVKTAKALGIDTHGYDKFNLKLAIGDKIQVGCPLRHHMGMAYDMKPRRR